MLLGVLLLLIPFCSAEDWNRFRGPNGSGVSTATGFPSELARDKNLLWRTPVRPGKSSPVLTEKLIFLTAFEDGKLYTQCYDRATGKLLWERSVPKVRDEVANRLNHPAAITPTTDGENVYSLFKDYGLVSYDSAGKLHWQVPLGPFANSMGMSAAPILTGSLVIVLADQLEGSYIAAFDRTNGETRWKIRRDELEAWGTPLLYQPETGGAAHVLTASRGFFGIHSARNGARTFTLPGISPTIVASPILHNDTLYVFGYGADAPTPFSNHLSRLDKNGDGRLTPDEYTDNALLNGVAKFNGNRDRIITAEEWAEAQVRMMGPSSLVALRLEPGANGQSSPQARELWRFEKGFTGVIPSALHWKGVLYVLKNGGILTSFNAATGKVLKTGRINNAPGGYSASPVAADGKLYTASEEGVLTVLKADGDWPVLSQMTFDEGFYATPALSAGRIYLRTESALYCFGSKSAQ
jgi:outer membrane protein assembly factor BamB